MAGDDVELEIDDLPNPVQHMLLRYVRSIFPRQQASPDELDAAAVDDDYEPERTARGGGARKKHKPMKKHEQEARIAQLTQSLNSIENVRGGSSGIRNDALPAAVKDESSGDEDSESSEEE